MNELQTTRTLEQVAMEIRGFTCAMLTNIIEIGRRMVEAKQMLPYGEFGNWIKENTGYSSSTANNFMRLYQEYGAPQGNLFGAEVECQTFGKLSYSKALALLSVPAEEREAFVQENDVDSMSSRELKQAIKEKQEAEERARAAEAALAEAEDGHGLAMAELQEKLDAAKEDAEAGKAALREKSAMLQELDMANGKLESARKEIEELKNRPLPVTVERDEKAIEEAVTQARAKEAADWSEKLSKLQNELEKAKSKMQKLKEKADKADGAAEEKIAAAEKETERIRQEMEETKRQLKLADAEVTAFGIHFTTMQQELNQALGALKKLAEKDIITAGKLNGAVAKVLSAAEAAVKELEKKAAAV